MLAKRPGVRFGERGVRRRKVRYPTELTMPRDSQIPLFLWIATAILVHLLWGGGAEHAATQIEQTLDIGRFARSVRQHVRLTTQTLEVVLDDSNTDPEDEPEAVEPDQSEPEEPEEDSESSEQVPDTKTPTPPKPETPPQPDPPEKEKEQLEEEKKKEEEEEKKKKEEEEAEKERQLRELLKLKQRVAVRQHVEDKNQKDNPDAEFLGEHANRVKEQTQARITSTEQNDPNPTPGGHHAGPDPAPGNSSDTRVGQLEDSEGDPDRAPSQTSEDSGATAPASVAQAPPRAGAPERLPEQSRVVPQAGQEARAAAQAQDPVAATLTSPGGNFSISREQLAAQEQRARKARQRIAGRQQRNDPTGLLGLGAQGLTENGINLNLSPSTAVAVIGQDQLRQELARDGERRRSEHRGSWKETNFQKYQSAIENYVAGVKPGNQTALNTAHSPFANYLNAIHQRLHPVFADRFLSSLDRMPNDHPLNDMEMKTNLEIVLRPDDGRIVRMGVTKASGVTAFDIGALESVRKASPFGSAPSSIVSPDGNVYLHWEFHRQPQYACSTYFARPYLLKAKPKSVPPKLAPPAKPYEGEEQPPGRQGHRAPVDSSEQGGVRTARR